MSVSVSALGILGFEILRPGLWWLGLVAAVITVAGWTALLARIRARARLAQDERLAELFPEAAPELGWVRLVLGACSVLLLCFALLGPVRGYVVREVPRRGLDLVLCLDTSRSMLVEDVGRSRLDESKRQVRGLIDTLRGDRVALVAFSGDVRPVAPLTRDRETFKWFLEALSPEDNRKGGTDLGAALEEALAMFDGRSGSHEAVVLITDGEDHEGRGMAIAEEAALRGIRVYVLGMGSDLGGKIPDGDGGWVRDATGAEVVSQLDGATLEAIAAETGGLYLPVEGSVLALERLYREGIARLEGRMYEDGKERVPFDRFQWPLSLGIICMLVEVGLRERRRRRRGSKEVSA